MMPNHLAQSLFSNQRHVTAQNDDVAVKVLERRRGAQDGMARAKLFSLNYPAYVASHRRPLEPHWRRSRLRSRRAPERAGARLLSHEEIGLFPPKDGAPWGVSISSACPWPAAKKNNSKLFHFFSIQGENYDYNVNTKSFNEKNF